MDFECWIAILLCASRLRRDEVGKFWIICGIRCPDANRNWFSQRLTSFIQDTEVVFINENAVAALTGEFAGDSDGNKVLHGFTGSREAHLVPTAWILNKKFCY